MVTLGIDAHKRSHTVVAVDGQGRQLSQRSAGTSSGDRLELVGWAAGFGERCWAVEDCRHLSRRLERDVLAVGERIVRVPPKLMANARASARSLGKSDPIDALAVARAALRERDLPVARLDGREREVRLLVDQREDLVGARTRMITRLRWHLHELDPGAEPAARTLTHLRNLDKLGGGLAGVEGTVARSALDLVQRCRTLTLEIDQLEREIATLVEQLAPSPIAICGCGPLTAPRSSARPPASNASKARTPTHATTAPRRCPSGLPTGNATGSAAPAIANSTPPSTASRSPRPAGTHPRWRMARRRANRPILPPTPWRL